MKPIEDFKNKIIEGDCMEIMKEMPDNSIDTIITDPPYGLEFMGKDWDKFKENKNFQEWNYLWAKEALRVAKPGATLLCFGGARTFHRLACGIEDAGWIIKDCIMWIQGQGFPKSTDISKQIDRQAGMERKVVGIRKSDGGCSGKTSSVGQYLINYGQYMPITEPATPEAKLWNGWHSHGLKPAYEPIIVAMKPNEGSYAENALKWGVSGLNIEEARIGTDKIKAHHAPKGTFAGGEERKSDTNYYNNLGRYPANIILDEEAAQELDKQSGINKKGGNLRSGAKRHYSIWNTQRSKEITCNAPDNYGDAGGASRFFKIIEDDYPRFIYCAKASPAERNMGCEGLEEKKYQMTHPQQVGTLEDRYNVTNHNNHPTVKPLKLMEYLCILTRTPSGGIVLDPFVGSGTTCMAAKKIGRDFIGIEREADYCAIARARIKAIKPNLTLNLK